VIIKLELFYFFSVIIREDFLVWWAKYLAKKDFAAILEAEFKESNGFKNVDFRL